MTSSQLPEGYEICPHCEGGKWSFFLGTRNVVCRLCMGERMIDWITKIMHRKIPKREKLLTI